MPSHSKQTRPLVVGIDGGGTKTAAWVARLDSSPDQVLGRGRAGPANPCSTDFTLATENLAAAIDAALQPAGLQPAEIDTICLGLAGISLDATAQRMRDWLRLQGLARQVVITDDAEPVLACAALDGPGVAIIAGTGSFALARAASGQTARIGGWGYRFGDEGSGYAIAIAGLSAAARAADGRGPATALLDRFLEHFQVATPRQLISQVYAPDVDRSSIANTARLVFDAAKASDPIANQIVVDAADSLSEMIVAAQRALQLPADLPIAVAGGAILGSPLLRARFVDRLASCSIRPAPLTEVPDPAAGALLLARRAAGQP